MSLIYDREDILEEKILTWLKRKKTNKIALSTLISEMKMSPLEKMELLGSLKHFKRLERTYWKKDKEVHCCLRVVA